MTITLTSTVAVIDLKPFVDRVIAAMEGVLEVEGSLVTDESCLMDFASYFRDRSKDHELYAQIGEKLGLSLDPSNKDDRVIVKIALRLKQQGEHRS